MFLLGGSSLIAFAVILLFSAGTQDKPLQKSMAVFLLGGVLLYFADANSAHGLVPGDIPGVLKKFILMFFD